MTLEIGKDYLYKNGSLCTVVDLDSWWYKGHGALIKFADGTVRCIWVNLLSSSCNDDVQEADIDTTTMLQ